VGTTVHDETWLLFDSFLIIQRVGKTPWVGHQPATRPLPTQDVINKINADKHPCPEWDSNPRPQCLSGRRQW
jgi:hypothetical protein